MPSNAQLALVGATGVASTAPLGTAFPVGFAALAPAWSDLGYISQDGMTASVSEEQKTWTPWGSLSPIRTQITKSEKSFKIVCWENNLTVLSLYYKIPEADLTPDAITHIIEFDELDKPSPDRRAFNFDILDGASNQFRISIAEGEITAKGDIVYKSDDLIGYEMTLTAYPDANGVAVKRLMKLAALV